MCGGRHEQKVKELLFQEVEITTKMEFIRNDHVYGALGLCTEMMEECTAVPWDLEGIKSLK